jgi:hypothetical protein
MATFTFTAFYPAPETAELMAELISIKAETRQQAEAKAAALVFGVNTYVDGWLELA